METIKPKQRFPITRLLFGLVFLLFLLAIGGLVLFVNHNVPAMGGASTQSGLKVEARSFGLLSGGVGIATTNGVSVFIGGKQLKVLEQSVTVDDKSIGTIVEGTELLEIVNRDGTISVSADGKTIATIPN